MTIKEMEKELIIKTLEDNDFNRTHSARILGITRRTLQHKLKEYNIDTSTAEDAVEYFGAEPYDDQYKDFVEAVEDDADMESDSDYGGGE